MPLAGVLIKRPIIYDAQRHAMNAPEANRGTGTCALPAPPKAREEILGEPFDEVDYNRGGITTAEQLDFENHVRDQVNTLGLAFKCGLTKVATLQLANADCRLVGKGMDVPTHYAAHFGNHDQRMHSTVYWTSELRDVLDTMAAYDMGNGLSMLDTTLVVLASEMGVPEHGGRPPFIIVGGQSGFFKQGEHVKRSRPWIWARLRHDHNLIDRGSSRLRGPWRFLTSETIESLVPSALEHALECGVPARALGRQGALGDEFMAALGRCISDARIRQTPQCDLSEARSWPADGLGRVEDYSQNVRAPIGQLCPSIRLSIFRNSTDAPMPASTIHGLHAG